jgi:hypothetical protein
MQVLGGTEGTKLQLGDVLRSIGGVSVQARLFPFCTL